MTSVSASCLDELPRSSSSRSQQLPLQQPGLGVTMRLLKDKKLLLLRSLPVRFWLGIKKGRSARA
jgi:hypothetical protein